MSLVQFPTRAHHHAFEKINARFTSHFAFEDTNTSKAINYRYKFRTFLSLFRLLVNNNDDDFWVSYFISSLMHHFISISSETLDIFHHIYWLMPSACFFSPHSYSPYLLWKVINLEIGNIKVFISTDWATHFKCCSRGAFRKILSLELINFEIFFFIDTFFSMVVVYCCWNNYIIIIWVNILWAINYKNYWDSLKCEKLNSKWAQHMFYNFIFSSSHSLSLSFSFILIMSSFFRLCRLKVLFSIFEKNVNTTSIYVLSRK